MITQLLLLTLFAPTFLLLHGLFAIIPDFNFLSGVQSQMTDAFSWFLGIVEFLNPIIPSGVMLSVIGIYLSFYAFYFGMKFISWILRKIPVIGVS